jgi:hypothetical protein
MVRYTSILRAMSVPRLRIRQGSPGFLDLPWEDRVAVWGPDIACEMPIGVHRHPVVFVPAERFEHFTRQIAELRPGFDPIQEYTDFLSYRYQRSAEAGSDIESNTAFAAWVEANMPGHSLADT